MIKDLKNEMIEKSLAELIDMITQKYGCNPFAQLDKALRIVRTRNYNHYRSIIKHFDDIGYILADRGETEFLIKMDEISELIKIGRAHV